MGLLYHLQLKSFHRWKLLLMAHSVGENQFENKVTKRNVVEWLVVIRYGQGMVKGLTIASN